MPYLCSMIHGKPGKSWNFRISFSTRGKCEFKRGPWKVMENYVYLDNTKQIRFLCEKKIVKTYPKWKMISNKMVKFRSWKTWKSHGKSWTFKSSKEYEPCMGFISLCLHCFTMWYYATCLACCVSTFTTRFKFESRHRLYICGLFKTGSKQILSETRAKCFFTPKSTL